eukprot:s564_g30.t1
MQTQAEQKCFTDSRQLRQSEKAKKPTRLMTYRIKYNSIAGLRCNHEPKTFTDSDGKEYKAAHERVAQRRRATAEGGSEYASKALGNYHPTFCNVIATAISKVNMERAMRARELRDEPLP